MISTGTCVIVRTERALLRAQAYRQRVDLPLIFDFITLESTIMTIASIPLHQLALATVAGLLCASAALAATPGAAAEAQARYRQDMAVCNSGQSNQDSATCRLEARNALAAAKRGELDDTPGVYQQNAMQRCAAHQGADRSDCEARMRGQGNVQGSVANGGILRESITIIPVK